MRVVPLASGSSGNSFLVQDNGSSILVDAGLSAKQIVQRLASVQTAPETVKAIVVSHGHSDHTKGIGVLSKKYKIPVWMNEGTKCAVGDTLQKIHSLHLFETGRIFEIAGFKIHPFSVPHDCIDPVGFRISKGAARLGIATDLGTATNLVANVLAGLQVVVLESNHDPKMLMNGPYPLQLKQRVKGRRGHLSNPDTAKLLEKILHGDLQTIILAHMSETNNTAELALDCARSSLTEFLDRRGRLFCAKQNEVGPTIEW